MGSLWRQYLRPASLVEALQALWSAPGPACPIAGGTDLLLDLRQGHRPPVHTLVDVSGIPDLTALEVRGVQEVRGSQQMRGEELFIGAAVPLSQVIASPLVHQHAQALVEACDLIGSPQVRNVATLGGNVAHALPAADGAIALLALDAYVAVACFTPPETISLRTDPQRAGALAPILAEALATNLAVDIDKKPILELYLGPGKTALEPSQLLVGFFLPLAGPGQGSAFKRVMRSQGVALAVVNLAVWLERDHDRVADLRIALGPAGPIPQRALAAESALRGKPLTPENLSMAQQALLSEAHFRTSPHRATAQYRQHLAGRLLAGTMQEAWRRAV